MAKGKGIVNTIGSVALITLIAKLLGFVREAMQSRTFDPVSFEDFSYAYNSTDAIFTTVGYALCVAAIPIIAQKMNESRAEGFRAANNIFCVTIVIALLVTITSVIYPYSQLMYSASPALLTYSRILTLALPVIVATYLFLALLQTLEHYTLQGSLSLPYNILIILFLVICGASYGLTGLVIVITVAWLSQLAMTIPQLKRERYRFRFHFDLRAPYMGTYIRTAAVTVITTSIYLFCYLIDTSMVSHYIAPAASGNIAQPGTAFYFADKIFTPIVTTLVYSITIVMFPKFNFRYVESTAAEYKHYVGNTVEKMIQLLLPLSLIFAAFATPIVKVLFEGGASPPSQTALTGPVLTAYFFGMTGFAILDMIAKAFYTMGRVKQPLLINLGILILNLLLNFALLSSLQSFGLALATSLTLTLGAIAMLITFFKDSPALKRRLLKIGKSILAAAVMAAALYLTNKWLIDIAAGKLLLVIECVVFGFLALLLYILIITLLGERDIWQTIVKRLKRER